jgi:hypothetical protein
MAAAAIKRRAPIAQDQEHDQAREQGAFDQRVDRAFVHAADEFDRRADLGDANFGAALFDLTDAFIHAVEHLHFRGAARTQHQEADDGLAVVARDRVADRWRYR